MKKILIVFIAVFFLGIGGFTPVSANSNVKESKNVKKLALVDDQSDSGDTEENTVNNANERKEQLLEQRRIALEKKKKETLERVRTKALSAVERAIKRFEKLKTRIEGMKVISDDRKDNVYLKIDEQIQKLQALKEKISQASTIEEIKDHLKNLRAIVKNSKDQISAVVKEIHATHLSNILEKINGILEKFDSKIDELKSENKDATKLEELSSEIKDSIEITKENISNYEFKKAKENILSIRKNLNEMAKLFKSLDNNQEGTE